MERIHRNSLMTREETKANRQLFRDNDYLFYTLTRIYKVLVHRSLCKYWNSAAVSWLKYLYFIVGINPLNYSDYITQRRIIFNAPNIHIIRGIIIISFTPSSLVRIIFYLETDNNKPTRAKGKRNLVLKGLIYDFPWPSPSLIDFKV
jgi:hypothetical protein